jgi:hypothetical protein
MALLSFRNLKKAVKNPAIAYKYAVALVKSIGIEKSFISGFFPNKEEFLNYKKEVTESGIIDELNGKRKWFERNVRGKTYRGNQYAFGAMHIKGALQLYSIIRRIKPGILVETGVCNGFSTSFILLALHKNNKGRLYSIDFPEVEGSSYENKPFWEKKRGNAIPRGQKSGWIIPEYLRGNWELTVGKSREKLPQLLKGLERIDFFMHDSEHSYECMSFEFNEAYKALNRGGVLMSDNIDWNSSFSDFCKRHNRNAIKAGIAMGFIVK